MQEFPQKIPVAEEHSLDFAGKAAPQLQLNPTEAGFEM